MILEAKNISKFYGSQKVLDDISFSLQKGKITGLLGENGAGKSTLIKILCGYINPKRGAVLLDDEPIGLHPLKYKKILGYLPENTPLYEELYVKEYLKQVAQMYRLKDTTKKLDEIIIMTGLTKEQHKKIKFLSKGFRQRVGLAQALIHNPKILILDEPSSGMDPNQLIELRKLLDSIQKEKIILFSSHNLNEIMAVCDRVIIIHNGKIVGDLEENFRTTDYLEKIFLELTEKINC